MIRCLAVDDEPLALRQLAAYIGKVPFLELAGECRSAADAKDIIDRQQIDAIFIDINMPDLSGMDFVKSLSAPPLVVFTTAYSEYAVDGYKVDAVDYLMKPFGLDDFKRAAQKVKLRFDLMNTAAVSDSSDGSIFLKTEYKIIRVEINDIVYIEGMSEYLRIFTGNGEKPLIVLLAMKKIEERLPSASFMRIHRSYIINLRKIKEINKNRVWIDSDTALPIGDSYKEAFNKYIEAKFLCK